MVELFEEKGYRFVNYDKADVIKVDQRKYWYEGDIMDKVGLATAFNKFNPTIVIHLAARTDTMSDKLEDYIENTEGTANVVNEIKKHDYVKHFLFASTQYVYKNAETPFGLTDESYAPHTVYGISKKMNEECIRNAGMKCKWTIFRPCNVWGPWHIRYPNELWKYIAKGFYVHPSTKPVIRTYAYVKNLVKQLDAIMNASDDLVDKKTYYLGDLPIDSYVWLNDLSQEINGKTIKRIPRFFFGLIAFFGDFMRLIKVKFPLYSVRYRNMIEDYYAPSNITIKFFGAFENDNRKNCKETIDWLRGDFGQNFKYWKKYSHEKK